MTNERCRGPEAITYHFFLRIQGGEICSSIRGFDALIKQGEGLHLKEEVNLTCNAKEADVNAKSWTLPMIAKHF